MRRQSLSAAEARRIVLAAQQMDKAGNPATVDVRHLRRVINTLGLLQLDFVNVLIPAHLFVLYSRLGAYDPLRFHRLVYQGREFTEQWAHEASIVPTSSWPLLEHRRKTFRPWAGAAFNNLRNKNKYLQQIIEIIEKNGPSTAQDMPQVEGPKRQPGDWHRSVARSALEQHFGVGQLAVHDRLPNFQRVYDLPERAIDDCYRCHTVDDHAAQRSLLHSAARASGVATLHDLADYYRMSPRDARPRIAELVEEGALSEIAVEGWQDTAYITPRARLPREATRRSLLSPFDPLVWFRPRAERLFGFHYRIEIYVPAARRRWGYYVLPFLKDDALAARVDLKADRKNSVLLVPAAHLEPGAHQGDTAEALALELGKLAKWLCLESISIGRKGNLSAALRKALAGHR